jgi:phosphopantetheinyl transferase
VPIIFKKQISSNIVAVWHIAEQEDFFLPRLPLSLDEMTELSLIKGKKRIEWLAARYLVHILLESEERICWVKDDFGKPYLAESNIFFNISHSGEMAAAIIGQQEVGIDIQIFTPKIARIASKFMREHDLQHIPEGNLLAYLHLFWAAKEALYKAYGRRELDFKEHIFVDLDRDILPYDRFFDGFIQKNEDILHYKMWSEPIMTNYILVCCHAT